MRAATEPGASEARKSDNSRQRIRDAAAYVLSREGYAGTKLSDIAARADLRISTLYYYFESREALVLDVLLTGSTHVRKHIEEAVAQLPPSTPPSEVVCAALESHLRYILEISHYTEAAVRNTNQLPEHLRTPLLREQAKYGHFWQRMIDAALDGSGYHTQAERRALRLLILGALNWTVEWLPAAHVSVDEVVKTALTMVRRALAAA